MSSSTNASPRKPAAELPDFDKLSNADHVRVPSVARVIGASVPTAWRYAREGRIPAPKKLGPGVTAWNVGELRAWLAAREG